MKSTLFAIAFALVAVPATAQAQWYGYTARATTPFESYASGWSALLRGQGAFIRSQSVAAENLTSAAINYEIARSRYIENMRAWNDIYLQRQRLLEAARYEEYQEDVEAWKRYVAMKPDVPRSARLDPEAFNPASGEIQWPAALQQKRFQADREEIEQLFLLRAHTSQNSYDVAQKAAVAISELQAELHAMVETLPAEEYVEARNFLDALEYEAMRSTS